VKYRLSAKAFQAVEAVSIGPAPGPAYISPELISGGKSPYSSIYGPPFLAATALPAPRTAVLRGSRPGGSDDDLDEAAEGSRRSVANRPADHIASILHTIGMM